MACGLEKVSDPSLTATFIEPYLKSAITDDFESTVSRVLTPYSVDSLKMGLQSLKEYKETRVAVDHTQPVRRNGFILPRELRDKPLELRDTPEPGGNGLLTILISYYPVEEEKHEIKYIDHATKEVTPLGFFPTCGFYTDEGCCHVLSLRRPCLLCGLTQDGNHAVLLAPKFPLICETRVIAIYQLAPPVQLFEKPFEGMPFSKCDAIGVALSPSSIMQGQYQVAIVTCKMAIILLNVVTLERSTLQLEWVQPQSSMDVGPIYESYSEHCVTFSPDGRFLSVSCYMQNESMNACLIIDVGTLEPLCWMSLDGHLSWLKWLFPMFSACGTKLVSSTFSEHENMYDESKYELMFYKISGTHSLKDLCRVVILECVRPTLIDQLPLPQDMISFLGGSRPTQMSEDTRPSQLCLNEEHTTCRCNVL